MSDSSALNVNRAVLSNLAMGQNALVSPSLEFLPEKAVRHSGPVRRSIDGEREVVIPTLFLLLLIALKIAYASALRIDSDETQHLHVVWGWAHGLLPYRDLFDNHSPLFQFLCSPLLRLLGERADIVVPMRLAVIPLYLICLWVAYEIARILFGARLGLWAAVLGGAFPAFFVKSSEFRTDDLWAALWLVGMLALVKPPFRIRNALIFGLTLGASFATSMKTTVLVTGLVAALIIILVAKLLRRERVAWTRVGTAAVVSLVGAAVLPAIVIGFFRNKGVLADMNFCVIQHNMAPYGTNTWDLLFKHSRWFVPAVALTAVAGRFSWHAASNTNQRDRVAFITAAVVIYLALLALWWPIVQSQDFLPVAPLIGILAAGALAGIPSVRHPLVIAGVIAICELLILIISEPPWIDATTNKEAMIGAVLRLTTPDDFVMDAKGETVFRRRPFYYVLEGITMRRLNLGIIKDEIPERLIATRTPVATLLRMPQRAHDFIEQNYLPIAFRTRVLGKMLGGEHDIFPKSYDVDIAVPNRYSIVSESGNVKATVDGTAADGPVFLGAGHHQIGVSAGGGRLALIWSRAAEQGFSPFVSVPDDRSRSD